MAVMETALAPSRPLGRKFSNSVVRWLMVVGAIMGLIGALLFSSITFLLKSESWVAHSYQVLDALDLTEAHYLDAQSAERGYAATCKPTLLAPFQRDLPQIFSQVATLRHLTADNPDQQKRAVALGKAVSAELQSMSRVVTAAANGQQLQAEAMLTDPGDVASIRRITLLIDEMQTAERALLNSRLKNITFFAFATLLSSAAGVLMIGGILVLVFRLIRRETLRREQIESSLQESNGKLGESLGALQKYNASARAISLLGELLQSCRSTEEAVSIAARHLCEVFPGAALSIALFTNSRDGLQTARAEGGGETFLNQFRADDCWALRRGRPHTANPGSFELPCDHYHRHGENFACIPMVAQGETIGILSIATAAPLDEFQSQTVQTIAEQLSLALANLKLQETLRSQSFRDPLTGLFNRRYMDEAMQREFIRADRGKLPVAVAMIDIDHFKRFNDTHGHEGGDVLLKAFGAMLAAHARGDDIICRYGGEEFAVILPGADLETAAARLDEIRLAVKKLHPVSGGQALGPVSLSAGVAVYPRDGATGGAVIVKADAALYEAKRSGRDRVMCAGTDESLVQSA